MIVANAVLKCKVSGDSQIWKRACLKDNCPEWATAIGADPVPAQNCPKGAYHISPGFLTLGKETTLTSVLKVRLKKIHPISTARAI